MLYFQLATIHTNQFSHHHQEHGFLVVVPAARISGAPAPATAGTAAKATQGAAARGACKVLEFSGGKGARGALVSRPLFPPLLLHTQRTRD